MRAILRGLRTLGRGWNGLSPIVRGVLVAFAVVVALGALLGPRLERLARWFEGGESGQWAACIIWVLAVLAGGLEAIRKPRKR